MDDHISKKLTRRVWFVCALGLFIDGYDLYISSIAEPFITMLYHPSPFMIGITQAAAPIGAALGAIVIGRMADKIGRKSLLIFNLIFFIIVAILSAMSWDIISLSVFRFLIGFGVGADYPICAAYLAEMVPKDKSNKLIALAMLINCLASPVGVVIAWVIFKYHPTIDLWRYLFALGAIPSCLALLLRSRLPESFVWKAQQRLIQKNDSLIDNYKILFSPQLKKTTACLGICWFLLDASYYGIGLFTPTILQALHISSEANFLVSANNMLSSTLIVNLFVIVGAFVAILLIEKIDLLTLQASGFLYGFFGLVILSLSYFASNTISIIMVFTGFILFNFSINAGPGITTYLLPVDRYATEIRATGHGLAAGIGKMGAFFGTIFLPILVHQVGIYIAVAILATTLLLGSLLTRALSNEVHHHVDNNRWITEAM